MERVYIRIILVQIALKHELGLLPILRYETRVILHARALWTIANLWKGKERNNVPK